MLTTTASRDEELDFVSEEDRSDLVIILDRRECQCRSYLCIQLTLRFTSRAEVRTPRHIYEKHHGQLPLFLEDFDVGLGIACCDIPVQITHIIPDLIATHFAEGHTSPSECRMILPGEHLFGESTSFDLDATYLLQEIGWLEF